MFHVRNIARGKGETGFYRKSHHFFTWHKRLPQWLFVREERFQQMDGLKKGKTVKFLKKALF